MTERRFFLNLKNHVMKKLLVLVLFCSISINLLSQTFVIKPAIGINVADFSKDPAGGTVTGKLGWQIGGSIAFGKKFYVEPGVFYGGQSTRYSSSNAIYDTTFGLNGIRIPVAIGYNFMGIKKGILNIRVFVGGSANILTSVSDGNKSDYTSPTWGVFTGLGVDIFMFFIDLKYEWSLTNVQNEVSQFDLGKSRTFYVNFGFRIPI